ncbi:TreA [Staphylococcus phage vB_Sau_S24]|nr:TreA [Staphylococcus phage vB_Sau_S24]
MISIYLRRDYSKNKLKGILKEIKGFAPRELTYGVDNVEADVNIEGLLRDDVDIFYSLTLRYPDDINILVGDSGYMIMYQDDYLTIPGLRVVIEEALL